MDGLRKSRESWELFLLTQGRVNATNLFNICTRNQPACPALINFIYADNLAFAAQHNIFKDLDLSV